MPPAANPDCSMAAIIVVRTRAESRRSRCSKPGSGLGLANVGARLRAHFGERGVLEAGPRPGGFRATLTLPPGP